MIGAVVYSLGKPTAAGMDHQLTPDASYAMEKNNGVLLCRSRAKSTPGQSHVPAASTALPSEYVATDAFLGRLGGNQRFALPWTSTTTPTTPADPVRESPGRPTSHHPTSETHDSGD